MSTIRFNLRPGSEPDRQAICTLLASSAMEADLPPQEFLVAEVDGQLVGLARLEWEGKTAYIRPVVVDDAWQGKGIGRRLIREISKGLPSVNVIARGSACGFYECIGFIPTGWDQIPGRYRQECITCPDLLFCQPVPMMSGRSTGDGFIQESLEEKG
jgi:N-acetylglutamate synthase-like GNAT family acetyltransferase